MLIDCGQGYTITADNITVPNTPSSFDVIQIATAATVPIFVYRIVATANAVAAAIQRVVLIRRSTASTGGTAVTPKPTNGGSAAASSTASYNLVTTTGTAGDQLDSQQWNEFAPYEFNQKPQGILVPAASWLSLFLPANPAAAFQASFTVEYVELK
jgi:hypothetical protein